MAPGFDSQMLSSPPFFMPQFSANWTDSCIEKKNWVCQLDRLLHRGKKIGTCQLDRLLGLGKIFGKKKLGLPTGQSPGKDLEKKTHLTLKGCQKGKEGKKGHITSPFLPFFPFFYAPIFSYYAAATLGQFRKDMTKGEELEEGTYYKSLLPFLPLFLCPPFYGNPRLPIPLQFGFRVQVRTHLCSDRFY